MEKTSPQLQMKNLRTTGVVDVNIDVNCTYKTYIHCCTVEQHRCGSHIQDLFTVVQWNISKHQVLMIAQEQRGMFVCVTSKSEVLGFISAVAQIHAAGKCV